MAKKLEQIIDESTRKAYDADWTWEDQQEAMKQGWGLFTAYDSLEELQLQFVPDPDNVPDDWIAPFGSDSEAWAFVKATAELGDALAKKALQRLFLENVLEYNKVMGLDEGEEKR